MPAIDRVVTVTIAVANQDEALAWFVEKLGFEKRQDTPGPDLRWLTVAPILQAEIEFLLADWYPDRVGKNPTWVLSTRDLEAACEELKSKGVEFTQKPSRRPYGIEAIFVDLYGNKYALVAPSAEVFTESVERSFLVSGPSAVPEVA
jgi:catechol 2,3-dioxygenase-like lactoylglutathione lyase family enzyme